MQAYILRREGKDYQAPDLETLRAWARDGRVLPGDMVYSPRYQSWYRARDLRELRSVLPAQEPATRSSARQQFWLRKGDQNYATDNLETILRWASEGNIDPDDYIYHPSYGKWFRAGDSPQLASRFPAHLRSRNEAFAREPGEDLEKADSVAHTAVDLNAEQIRLALERRGTLPGPGPTPALTGQSAQMGVARPVVADVLAVDGVGAAEVEPATRDTRPTFLRLDEAEPAADARRAAELAGPGTPDAAEMDDAGDAQPPAMEVDRDARFHDRFGAMRLFYDIARAFVVTRDMRPGELMEADCTLPSTGDTFRGQTKKAIYSAILERMVAHQGTTLAGLGAKLRPDERPGYHLLLVRVESLVDAVRRAEDLIGQKPPERFVVGNKGRPKMTPAEEHAMLMIDAALTGVISVRKRT